MKCRPYGPKSPQRKKPAVCDLESTVQPGLSTTYSSLIRASEQLRFLTRGALGMNSVMIGSLRSSVPVKLAPVARPDREQPERTVTDNISPHRVRVRSRCAWRLDEPAEVVPTRGGRPYGAKWSTVKKLRMAVSLCFFVGLKFRSRRVPWSTLQRFNALLLAAIFCSAMPWKG